MAGTQPRTHDDEANDDDGEGGEAGSSLEEESSSSSSRPPPQSQVRATTGAAATESFEGDEKVPAAGRVRTIEGGTAARHPESDPMQPTGEGDDGCGEMREFGSGDDAVDGSHPTSATSTGDPHEGDEDNGDDDRGCVDDRDGSHRSPSALAPESAPASSIAVDVNDGREGGLRSTIKELTKSMTRKKQTQFEATDEDDGQDDLDHGDAINRTMLHKAVSSAGRWAYSVVLVEVWVLDPRTNRLVRPDGGYWRDPVFPPSDELLRIEDRRRKDYVTPTPQGPGEGLAGILWTEMGGTGYGQRPTLLRGGGGRGGSGGRHPGGSSDRSRYGIPASTRTTNTYDSADVENQRGRRISSSESLWTVEQRDGSRRRLVRTNRLVWRDVSSIVLDPDRHPSPRMNLLAKAGFGLAAGVGFHVRNAGTRGIVVYMARRSVDASRLRSATNEAYMTRAADAVGAECALASARKASVDAREAEHAAAVRRARVKLAVVARMYKLGTSSGKKRLSEAASKAVRQGKAGKKSDDGAGPAPSGDEKAERTESDEYFSTREKLGIVSKGKVWRDKCFKGLDVDPPPSTSFGQTCWTMVGVFATMIILSAISVAIGYQTDREYKLLLGPFGALMTLQYSLTSAPASQPRNVMYGQVVAMTIALVFNYIPTTQLSPWLRIALVPTLAIGAMAKLGVTHPPAGASALVFAYGGYDWINFGLVLLGCAVAICTATAINNLSDRRQYPTYWAFLGARWGGGYLRTLLRGNGEGDGGVDDGCDGTGCFGCSWWQSPLRRSHAQKAIDNNDEDRGVLASKRASSHTATSKEVELTPTLSE